MRKAVTTKEAVEMLRSLRPVRVDGDGPEGLARLAGGYRSRKGGHSLDVIRLSDTEFAVRLCINTSERAHVGKWGITDIEGAGVLAQAVLEAEE